MSSTHLFILTKRLRLTITSTSLTINILIPAYLHKNVTHTYGGYARDVSLTDYHW